MSKSAVELAELIAEKRLKSEARAYDSLKAKIVSETSRMIADLESEAEVVLDNNDLKALSKVTEALRDLGYKFKFIEVQDSSGEILKHKLSISIAHLL